MTNKYIEEQKKREAETVALERKLEMQGVVVIVAIIAALGILNFLFWYGIFVFIGLIC